MKVSDFIVNFLKNNDVKHIFGYIGGFNADIIDSLYQDKNPQHSEFILNYHEQASAFAINAYSALTEKPAVATASGAPSSCNLVAGIANAYFDSNPCVFIVGSPHSLGCRTNKNLRQNLFEEIDMVAMVSDITKYAIKVTDKNDIKYILQKAFYIANSGRKGSVLVDVPYNIARSDVDEKSLKSFIPSNEEVYDSIDVQKILSCLKSAKRPVVLFGGGMRKNSCRQKMALLLNRVKIPCVASLCGMDVLSHNNNCFVGFIGHYGNRYANLAVANSDCLIILGSRLDERQLGGYKTQLAPDAKIIRVDIDKFELNRKLHEDVSIWADVESFLDNMLAQDFSNCNYEKWINLIAKWKQRYPSYDETPVVHNANNFIHTMSDFLPKNAIICADVGQNQMCVAQSVKLDNNRRLINSAGYGSMGFSLPAAIGAAYATNKKTLIVSVNGDGGLQMNIQELHTLVRDKLPVNVIVLNNNCLGMIRKTQEKLYENRNPVSVDGYSVPDYEKIATAYNIPYTRITSVADYTKLKEVFNINGPHFIEVDLPVDMENYPEPGNVIDEQTPQLNNEEMQIIKKECNVD